MNVNVIAWGPDAGWPTAFSASLQPVTGAGQNQTYRALLTSVIVSDTAVPEPSSWMLTLTGLGLVLGLRKLTRS